MLSSSSSRLPRVVAAAAAPLVISALLFIPLPAAADGDDAPQKLQLVLDASGSMAEPAKGGGTKIAAARTALTNVVETLPDEAVVGMRVYGATVDTGKGACTDSQQVVEPGTDNRDALTSAVGDYKPLGETPIGYALQQAGKDLGTEGKRTIVLVSDGESTCDPDPCRVARDLSQDGIDLKIDVVGLSVDAKTRKELRCIADAGHGTYYDADSAADLTERLEVTSTRAFRPFDFTGTPVQGTASRNNAPEIGVGQWLDKVPAKDTVAFYKIPRTIPGSTIHVGATTRTPGDSLGSGLVLQLDGDDLTTSCNTGSAFETAIGGAHLVSGSVNSWSSSALPTCQDGEELYLGVKISVDSSLAGAPVELVVYEEPPLTKGADAQLSPAAQVPTWQDMEPGTPTAGVVPGTGFGSAAVIEPGTYRFTIRSGEHQMLAVPLSWGQNVQAQIDADLPKAAYDGAGVHSGFDVRTIGPTRTDTDVDLFAIAPKDWRATIPFGNMWIEDDKHWRRGSMTVPAAYANRADVKTDVKASALAGYTYIDVGFTNAANDAAVITYDLTMQVFGEAQEEPAYAEGGDAVAPEADTVGAPPAAGGDPADGDADGPGSDDVAAASRSSDGGPPWLALGVGGFGLLLVAGGAAAVLLARRPKQPAAPQPPQQPWNGGGPSGW
ncbi:VWA domain-containing protein [Mumia zhuanghuii]|uniref:VWA domain-containing protein n=2 Tax=Mumia TaxID=1546255 RepID=A0ABW1QSL8_9ACTN|nr:MULTISPECIES: VWA domain-containing protein [Mumia]KAA1422425.1 VWA domain-containing protein [Mumia zhuanghuii]